MRQKQKRTDYIPSISRSGGLDGEGNMLKNPELQEKLFRTIEDRLGSCWEKRSPGTSTAAEPSQLKLQKETEMNILIELRKLREGIVSLSRSDAFAIRVYELSFYLSTVFDSLSHLQSVSSRLIHVMYADLESKQKGKGKSPNDLETESCVVITIHMISLLHQEFPSQSSFQRRLAELSPLLPSENISWLRSLAAALVHCNVIRLNELFVPERTAALFPASQIHGAYSAAAVTVVSDKLREVSRARSWEVTRSAYRELSRANKDWISKVLLINDAFSLPEWIKDKEARGEIVVKPNVEGVWSIPRVAASPRPAPKGPS